MVSAKLVDVKVEGPSESNIGLDIFSGCASGATAVVHSEA